MPTKRTLLVTALVALLVATSGCSALQGGGGPDGQAIAERSNEAMQDIERYNFEMSMSLSSNQADQTIDINASGAANIAEERLRMEMDMMGQSITQYIVGDTQYVNQGGTWQKMNMSGQMGTQQDIWDQQQLAQQQDILENASVSFEGNTTIDGEDVYELSVDIDEEQLMDVIQQQQGQALGGQISLDDISYTMYVTHADNYIKRINADMSMSMGQQNVDATLEMTFNDLNGDVTIELPPEAENAESMTMG